jgi:flap endonuclease-1
MGIQGLTKLLADNAAGCFKETDIKNFFGRKIAIDASMSMYQFLIAVRPDQNSLSGLTDETGETTRYDSDICHDLSFVVTCKGCTSVLFV